MSYRALLDTSTLSHLLDEGAANHKPTSERFRLHDGPVAISIVTIYELKVAERMIVRTERAGRLFRGFEIVPLPEEGAEVFARLKVKLARTWGGKPRAMARHNVDLMVAATAIVGSMRVVSSDAMFRALARTESTLRVEDWTKP